MDYELLTENFKKATSNTVKDMQQKGAILQEQWEKDMAEASAHLDQHFIIKSILLVLCMLSIMQYHESHGMTAWMAITFVVLLVSFIAIGVKQFYWHNVMSRRIKQFSTDFDKITDECKEKLAALSEEYDKKFNATTIEMIRNATVEIDSKHSEP